ncbi:MAG: SLBB domain-containing protein [Verrucomicrobiota bacterium]
MSATVHCIRSVWLLVALSAIGQLAFAQSDSGPGSSQRKIAAGDTIKILVFEEESMTTEAAVTSSGKIMYPFLGEIHVEGKTLAELAEMVRSKLDEDYIIDPKVSVFLVAQAVEEISVMGAVEKPGQVKIPENNTLNIIQAIGMAGGFAEDANRSKIILHRNSDKGVLRQEVLLKSEQALLPLKARDSITVLMASSSDRLTIIGEVEKPGTINVAPEQMPIDLLSAVALAGGFTEMADLKQVLLKRSEGEENRVFTLNAQEMLEDPGSKSFFLKTGDIVTVNTRKKQMITVMGQVEDPGGIELPANPEQPVDLLRAIAMAGGFTNIADPKRVQLRRTNSSGEVKVYKINTLELANNPESKPLLILPGDVITIPESLF